jgi:hypothetical protein
MNQSLKIFALFIFIICTLDSLGQVNLKQKTLTPGSEEIIKNSCNDTCIIVYKSYTVITHPHNGSCGEDIIITENNNNKRVNIIDVKDEYKAQYFSGIINDKAIINVETGLIISVFIYDLKSQRLVDSLKDIFNEPIVVDDKLYYSVILTKDKIKRLDLPTCDNPNLEFSGYIEFMYYNLENRNITSAGKFKCIN